MVLNEKTNGLRIKIAIIILLAGSVLLSLLGCSAKNDISSTARTNNDIYTEEFKTACSDISLDVDKINGWEQIDGWANGERFRFTYEKQSVLAYINFDGSISSINIGTEHIYEKGYEPYNVNDFIIDVNTAENLIPLAEDTVKSNLNYPSMAKFALLDWAFGRNGNVYALQSSVNTKNGFGVESDVPFTIMFDLSTEGKAKCVYLALDGDVIADQRTTAPERKKLEAENGGDSNNDEWRLVDGQLGKYGKQDHKYPEYVDFYVPVGKYAVDNNIKNSIVMIIDDKSNDEISRIPLAVGESGEIEVKAGQHIELTMYSDVTLKPLTE